MNPKMRPQALNSFVGHRHYISEPLPIFGVLGSTNNQPLRTWQMDKASMVVYLCMKTTFTDYSTLDKEQEQLSTKKSAWFQLGHAYVP